MGIGVGPFPLHALHQGPIQASLHHRHRRIRVNASFSHGFRKHDGPISFRRTVVKYRHLGR